MKKFKVLLLIGATCLFLLSTQIASAQECCIQDEDLFPDVQIGHEYYDQINYLNREEIFLGAEDGNFYPESPLNRAEFATIVVRLSGAEPDPAEYNNCFPDVTDQWFAAPVCFAQEQGWVQGYGEGDPNEGTYGPENPVQDIEVLVILSRFSNWDMTDGGEWYEPALNYAQDANIYDEEDPITSILREKTADVMFRDLATTPFDHDTYSDDLKEELFNNSISDLIDVEIVDPEPDPDPEISEYEQSKVTEAILLDQVKDDMYKEAFLGSTGEPQMMPYVPIFNPMDGIDFEITMGIESEVEGEDPIIVATHVVLYDLVSEQWVYGYDSDFGTSLLKPSTLNDFADQYTLLVTELYDPVSGINSNLVNVDPSKGYLVHVVTDDDQEFIVGFDDVNDYDPNSDDFDTISDSTTPHNIGEDIGGGSCPDVDVLAALQGAFTGEGVEIDTSNLDTSNFNSPMPCGQSVSSVIRLNDDLEVLPSHQEIEERVANDDIPEGGFKVADYILTFNIYSYCDTQTWECIVTVSYRLIEYQTGLVIGAGYTSGLKEEDLDDDFSEMLDDVETRVSDNEGSAQELH